MQKIKFQYTEQHQCTKICNNYTITIALINQSGPYIANMEDILKGNLRKKQHGSQANRKVKKK